jgi:uncharacterized membrane protein YbaN (DUF454 family)
VRLIFFILAWISFCLGVIGAFLPVIPTTPFLILSGLLFSKSSPRFHRWLLDLPVAGEAIKDWNQNRVIRTRAKVLCLSMMTLSMAVIFVNEVIPLPVKILVAVILISLGTFVVLQKGKAS